MSEQRSHFEALARSIKTAVEKAIDDGARPSTIMGALFACLSFVVANTDADPAWLERVISDGAKRVVPMGVEARKAAGTLQ